MGRYAATVTWARDGASFVDNDYSRAHEWHFDGGVVVPASASPQIVPPPHSVPANVDPEEAFVAALSSCHMLFFLSLAAERGILVDSYRDEATGRMGRNAEGCIAMTEVVLRPAASYGGETPPPALIEELHHAAHEQCFIANSVRTDVRVDIRA